jgi:putative transposase
MWPPASFYDWRERYGKVNEHNGGVPRDFWLGKDWEKQATIGFHLKNPLGGYRHPAGKRHRRWKIRGV